MVFDVLNVLTILLIPSFQALPFLKLLKGTNCEEKQFWAPRRAVFHVTCH